MNEKNEKNRNSEESKKRRPLLDVEKRRREEREELRKDNRLIKGKKDIYVIGAVFGLIFAGMLVYYAVFLVKDSETILQSSYNPRNAAESDVVMRGSILSSDGTVLVQSSINESGEEVRTYNYGALFAHAIGYSGRGLTGVESSGASDLLDAGLSLADEVYLDLEGEKATGNSVVTTLDLGLQQVAYEALGDYTGAVIALDPKTGAILAMVSKPDYDPNTIAADWDAIVSDSTNSCLVNRATQGLYPPGSTFKVLTALEYFREYPDTWESFTYDCTGTFTSGDVTIHCVHGTAHGLLDITGGLTYSCNGVFLTLGSQLNLKEFRETVDSFGFNSKLPVDFEYKKSQFTLDGDSSDFDRYETVFGQGETLITPLQMCMIASSIANDGQMMVPYIIAGVQDAEGNTLKTSVPEVWRTVMNQAEADTLTAMMENVVNNGTGYLTQSTDYQSACKTGSAQFDSSEETHAWYMGFAPADDPQIAVVVILEDGGSGGINAGPIAKMMYDEYLLR